MIDRLIYICKPVDGILILRENPEWEMWEADETALYVYVLIMINLLALMVS